MPRQSKDPQERRQELMDAAEQLFLDRGFENILVSDIVKQLGVAQGTFYYYFKSKDEILSAILERKWDRFAGHLEVTLAELSIGPLEKLQTLLAMLFRPQSEEQGGFQYFKTTGEWAGRFHGQFDQIRIVKLEPIIRRIIRDGIVQGDFIPMQHPDEITEILFHGVSAFMHHHSPNFTNAEYFNDKMGALEEVMTRVLGIGRESLHFREINEGKKTL